MIPNDVIFVNEGKVRILKAETVMQLLGIGRTTLRRWRETGKLRATPIPETGHFNWDAESVYEVLNNGVKRKTILYGRVPFDSQEQNTVLEERFQVLQAYASEQEFAEIEEIRDISSGLCHDKATGFRSMLELVSNYQVARIIIMHKSQISRTDFNLFRFLFSLFGTDIIVLSETENSQSEADDMGVDLSVLLSEYYGETVASEMIGKLRNLKGSQK